MEDNKDSNNILSAENEKFCKIKEDKNFKHQSKRNYGIDLLKMLAMVNIINLHINRVSKLLKISPKNPKYRQIFRLQTFSFWPVDAFGLISGIIGYKRYKFANLIYLWFESLYYSIILSIYLYSKSLLNSKQLFMSIFPLGIHRLWYVNAYFFMYLLLPFIINSINIIDKKSFTKIIQWYFIMYSFYHKLNEFNGGKNNYDFVNNGYSSIWIVTLFIIGGYIGRFYINKPLFSKFIFLIIYLLSSFFTSEFIFFSLKKYNISETIFMRYNSPTIIIQAISLIFFFSNLNIQYKFLRKVIFFFTPLNFNVTLIHLRIFYSKTRMITKFFNYVRELNAKFLFFKIYGLSLLIYFICAFFDYFRYLVFKNIKIKNFCYYLEKKLF